MWLHYVLILYILLISIVLNGVHQKKAKKILYLALTFGLFTILAALRSGRVGNDTSEYLRLFNSISITEDISAYYWRYEKGYLLLNKILSLLTNNSQIILIVTSLITMIGFARFIYKYSNNIWLSVYMFFTLGYFGMSMNTIRINIAIVILLFSYDFLAQKKLIKFSASVFLACLFHKTAIIFLLAWVIVKLKYSYKIIGVAITGSLGLYLLFPLILNKLMSFFPTYQYYIGSDYLDGDIRLASVMNFFVGISIVTFGIATKYHKKGKHVENTKDILNYNNMEIKDAQNMLLLLIASVSITFVSFKFNLLDRVGEYFAVFAIIYLPNALKKLNNNLRIIVTLIVIFMFFIYATTIQIMRPEWNVIYPYSFFWKY